MSERDRPASLGEQLAWLDRHINLEAIEAGLAGRAAAPTLERIAALCAAMGEPQASYPVIHVTGTNGKGSTTRMCSALLRAAGLSVGTLTSPHLESMNERICYNLEPISDEELAGQLVALREFEAFVLAAKKSEIAPTWFELVTAAAFRYFSDVAVEVGAIEVGLGGRFDATNVADATVAVLTNVDLDHVEILGPTRRDIASEKAGIVKAGSAVVVGDRDQAIIDIFSEEAARVGAASLWRRDVEFGCDSNQLALGGRVLSLRTPGGFYDEVFLPLHGAHQGDNASVALASVEAFFGAPLGQDVIEEAFSRLTVPGRLEVLDRRPLVVLDGAHNVAGARVLGAALAEDFAAAEQIVVVMGCLRGRSPQDLLREIASERIIEVIACAPPSPRALPGEAVKEAALSLGLSASASDEVEDALARARSLVGERDLILVAGSLYLVGAARTVLGRVAAGRP